MNTTATTDRGGPAATAQTVAFVDLVRFTSLTAVHGDSVGADAAETLASIAKGQLVEGSRIVKQLGDGILIVSPSPRASLRTMVGIVEALHELDSGADARCGASHGPVIDREGDVYGSTVNLASRAAALASPGHLIVTRPIAEEVVAVDLVAVPLGEQRVSGFMDAVELFDIDPCLHDDDWSADPVCGMRLSHDGKVVWRTFGKSEIAFCSNRCADIFVRSPERFS